MKINITLLTVLIVALSVPAMAASLELTIDPATGGPGKFAAGEIRLEAEAEARGRGNDAEDDIWRTRAKLDDTFSFVGSDMVRPEMLADLGITAGEGMPHELDSRTKQRWLSDTYGEGVRDALNDERVRRTEQDGRHLLVGTSYGAGAGPRENDVRSSDFLLLHGNDVKEPERITEMVRKTRGVPGYRPMPILFHEDDHFNFDRPSNNFASAVGEYASWGYFDFRIKDEGFDEGFQSVPVNWRISSARRCGFFRLLSEMTGAKP